MINYLKYFLKDHKKGGNLFEFMSLFVNFYSKVHEKLPLDSDTIQAYYLSKIVHEKYITLNRSAALKLPKVKKIYDKPLSEIERELGISNKSKNDSQQEALAKKAKEAEKNLTTTISSIMDHILFILELEQCSSTQIKISLEQRKQQTEPLFGLDQIKSLEIIGLPKKQHLLNNEPEVNCNIHDIKDLCTHLSSVLCMVSALYSCLFSRNMQLE